MTPWHFYVVGSVVLALLAALFVLAMKRRHDRKMAELAEIAQAALAVRRQALRDAVLVEREALRQQQDRDRARAERDAAAFRAEQDSTRERHRRGIAEIAENRVAQQQAYAPLRPASNPVTATQTPIAPRPPMSSGYEYEARPQSGDGFLAGVALGALISSGSDEGSSCRASAPSVESGGGGDFGGGGASGDWDSSPSDSSSPSPDSGSSND